MRSRLLGTLSVLLVCLMGLTGCRLDPPAAPAVVDDLAVAFKDMGVPLSHEKSIEIQGSAHTWHNFDLSSAGVVVKEYGVRSREFLAEHSDEGQETICAITEYRNENDQWPASDIDVVNALAAHKLTTPHMLLTNFVRDLSETEAHFGNGVIAAEVQSFTLYCEAVGLLKFTG